MSLDHYITLGRSGLRVSPFCLGAMTFGEDLGWGSSVEESQRIIDRFIELGGNFIDTANFYTKSHSEKIIMETTMRTPTLPAASGWSSQRNSAATCIREIPMAAGQAANRSLPRARIRCVGCRPII